VKDHLDRVFGAAAEMAGVMAPWEMAAERQFVADVHATLDDAITHLPPAIRRALAFKLEALALIRDTEVAEERANYEACEELLHRRGEPLID
jgi:hypothetical protein